MTGKELLKHCLFALNSIPNTDLEGYIDYDISTTYKLASEIDKFFKECSQEPTKCPKCGHEEITKYNADYDIGYKIDYIQCDACNVTWEESWTFDGWWFDKTGE